MLTIGGSDPTGGAGIEADAQTVRELGGHGAAVATALTVQDSSRVYEVVPISAEVVARRLAVLLADIVPDAIKTGMLADAAVAAAVVGALPDGVPLVVDPVILSSSGAVLLDDGGLAVVREQLLPRATVITPNHAEAAALLGREPAGAAELLALAPAAVVTGGDGGGEDVVDVLADADGVVEARAVRLPGPSPHGTGCAFATALAVRLAMGDGLRDAFEFARLRVRRAVARARPARGSAGRPLLGMSGEEE